MLLRSGVACIFATRFKLIPEASSRIRSSKLGCAWQVGQGLGCASPSFPINLESFCFEMILLLGLGGLTYRILVTGESYEI
jgi:hypothetical protein